MEDEVGWARSNRCHGATNGRTTGDRDGLAFWGTSSLLDVGRSRSHR
jgi:hypothetical protein